MREKVNRVNSQFIQKLNDLKILLDKKNEITNKVFSLQNEKINYCVDYDQLLYSQDSDNTESSDLTPKEYKMREISQQMTLISNRLEESVMTLEQVTKCVDEEIRGKF